MATATQRAEEADGSVVGDVTLGQKMLSAVSGSVLTSLLGTLRLVVVGILRMPSFW